MRPTLRTHLWLAARDACYACGFVRLGLRCGFNAYWARKP